MTGYTRLWDCLVCAEPQESIDWPKVEVCEACLRPLASLLCWEALRVKIGSEGVDTDHWVRKAQGYAERLYARRSDRRIAA